LHTPSPLALKGWAPALDALVDALQRADAEASAPPLLPLPLPPQPRLPSRRSSRLMQGGKK